MNFNKAGNNNQRGLTTQEVESEGWAVSVPPLVQPIGGVGQPGINMLAHRGQD